MGGATCAKLYRKQWHSHWGKERHVSMAHDSWDRRFSEHGWSQDPDPSLVELCQTVPPGDAIDLGCGPGRNAIWLARHGFHVVGVDTSVVGLEQAAERAKAEGLALELVAADIFEYEVPREAFDLAVVANMHPGRDRLAALLRSATDGLKPGGHLFVVGHHLDSLGHGGPPREDLLFNEDRLREALPSGLLVERLQTLERSRSDSGSLDTSRDVMLWARKGPRPLRDDE